MEQTIYVTKDDLMVELEPKNLIDTEKRLADYTASVQAMMGGEQHD